MTEPVTVPPAVRYHVLISDELMASHFPAWPRCLRLVEQEPTDPQQHPGMHWWLMEDDDAPPELEGKRVELTLTSTYDSAGGPYETTVTGREVLP